MTFVGQTESGKLSITVSNLCDAATSGRQTEPRDQANTAVDSPASQGWSVQRCEEDIKRGLPIPEEDRDDRNPETVLVENTDVDGAPSLPSLSSQDDREGGAWRGKSD